MLSVVELVVELAVFCLDVLIYKRLQMRRHIMTSSAAMNI